MTFRVLLISDSYPPVMGGSEIEAQRVAAGLISRGHRVQVLCSGGPPMPPVRNWTDPLGNPVSILTRRSRGRHKDIVFASHVAFSLWSRRNSYDIVYFLMQGLHLAAGLPVAHSLGKPIVVKIAGSGVIPMMRNFRAGCWELDWMKQWRIPVMVLNDGMIQEALADGFEREQLVWMPNPVDVDEFRPALPGEAASWREEHQIPLDAHVAIYVGRLSQEKGLPGLLRGFARTVVRDSKALLLLVGDGLQRYELENMARELHLGPEHLRLAGRVDPQQIPFWLRAADVFALTSPSEGFACALVEGMSVGLPSVVSAIPANLQLVDEGVHGLTMAFDDEQAIADALLRLFRDAPLRQTMGQQARQRVVDNFSTDRVIQRYEELFAKMQQLKEKPKETPAP